MSGPPKEIGPVSESGVTICAVDTEQMSARNTMVSSRKVIDVMLIVRIPSQICALLIDNREQL